MATAVLEPGVYPLRDDYTISDWVEGKVDWHVCPFVYGPTWSRDPDWTGPRDPQGYILPVYTLGWQAIRWVEENLLADELDENDKPLPFRLTDEQKRFILWFYAVDETGRFQYREVVLQRLKGHGKDPLAVVISCIEFVGPCRFKGWAARDMPEIGVAFGEPVAKPHPRAWIQVAAVTLSQTQNSMDLFRGIFTDACKAEHSIDIGKEVIYAYAGQKKIQAVTSNPRALEGNRPTLVIVNEPHQWVKNNEGLAMWDAMERNATKAKGGAARTLAITNAYDPNEESVGRMMRESYEQQVADGYGVDTMYDTLEAPKQTRLRPLFPDEAEDAVRKGIPEIPADVKRELHIRYLTRAIEAVRGDAWWLDIPSLVASILNPKNKPSRSRRFWLNQITASEEVWVHPSAVDAAISPLARDARASAMQTPGEILRAGWLVSSEDKIVMFFDGSKSDDSTALVGCRLSDGYVFTIGVWQKPKGDRGKGWLAPRREVDLRVREAFKRFNIVAFWGDPSHSKDDVDDSSYWMGLFDEWMRDFKDQLEPAFWPVKGGLRKHAINFDMTGADRMKTFIEAAELFVDEMEQLNDIEEFAPSFEIDGHPALVAHLKNAVAAPHPLGWGTSLSKEHRESDRKIDLAVCAVGARMLRRIVLNGAEKEEEEPGGEVWGW